MEQEGQELGSLPRRLSLLCCTESPFPKELFVAALLLGLPFWVLPPQAMTRGSGTSGCCDNTVVL